MTKHDADNDRTKAVVTVTEMARMCGLSRSRFYQLMRAGVFPPPVYELTTRRAHYIEPMQRVCLQVRQQNCGINGQPVFFYARRVGPAPVMVPRNRSVTPKSKGAVGSRIGDDGESSRCNVIFLGVLGLGLDVTPQQVAAVVKAEYPAGIGQVTEAEVIRRVFLVMKRQNSADKLGG